MTRVQGRPHRRLLQSAGQIKRKEEAPWLEYNVRVLNLENAKNAVVLTLGLGAGDTCLADETGSPATVAMEYADPTEDLLEIDTAGSWRKFTNYTSQKAVSFYK